MAVAFRKNGLYPGTVVLMILLWSMVLVSRSHAAVVDDLYQATAPLTGQNDEQLSAAYQAGLEKVLVRVSGDREVTRREGMQAHLDNARTLLSSWQVEPAEADRDHLQMAFSPRAINRILADTGARVWGVNRPATLAWIAVQDGGDRGLLVETGESSEQGWSALIRDEARNRGLPLALPPADRASDRRLLSEVWGQFMGQIAQASSGIEHDLLAVVRISRRNAGWQASWLYQGRGIEQSRTLSADNPEALVSAMIDAWTAELAARYAASGGAINTGPYVRLVVEGVRSSSDYASIKRALSQLNPVEAVGAMTVSGDRIVFRVEHNGEVSQLQQNIALDDRFRALADETANGSGAERNADAASEVQTLAYRWQHMVISPSGSEQE